MDKKESPKKESNFKSQKFQISEKPSVFSNKIFQIIKFILGICTLPFVYSVTFSFLNQMGFIESYLARNFWVGVISFLVIYLFIWEPGIIYSSGHKILEVVFAFFKPLVNVAPNLLPIYMIVVFILYGILSAFIKDSWLLSYVMFLFGFSVAMHLVFSARSIMAKKDLLRANYIFGFSLIYVLNVVILAFCLSAVFKEFSFVRFSESAYSEIAAIFSAVFRQLFSV